MAQPKLGQSQRGTGWEQCPSHCPSRQRGAGSHAFHFCPSFSQWHRSCGCHQSLCPCPEPLRTWGQTQSSGRVGSSIYSQQPGHGTQVMLLPFASLSVVALGTNLHVATHTQVPANIPETASTREQGQHWEQPSLPAHVSSISETSSACLPPLAFTAAMPRCQNCKGIFLFFLEISLFLSRGSFL